MSKNTATAISTGLGLMGCVLGLQQDQFVQWTPPPLQILILLILAGYLDRSGIESGSCEQKFTFFYVNKLSELIEIETS
jgi:hypothetical protein